MTSRTERTTMSENAGTASVCDCKVGRVLEEFGLTDVDAELARRWRTREASVRDLQEYFNREVLKAATRDAMPDTLDGEVENLYRLLTDDDVSRGMRAQARNRLERQGVDVEGVTESFVSHQTIYRHLRGCTDVEPEEETEAEPVEQAVRRLRRLRSRTETVTRSTLESLQNNGHVGFGDFDVLVDVTVVCNDCGTRKSVVSALRDGGCACEAE
jgi:hypothetical protein